MKTGSRPPYYRIRRIAWLAREGSGGLLRLLIAATCTLAPLLCRAVDDQAAAVAVMDFRPADATNRAAGWSAGLEDLFEIELQKQGVATFERRSVRLLLGERRVWRDQLVAPELIKAGGLPHVRYLISGEVRGSTDGGITIDAQVVDARNGTSAGTFAETAPDRSRRMVMLSALARRIAEGVAAHERRPPAAAQAPCLTWLPEASRHFFAGMQAYAAGDAADAAAHFRLARIEDDTARLAWLWEARAYQRLGVPELAEVIIERKGLSAQLALPQTLGGATNIVAVLAGRSLSAACKAAFIEEVRKDARFVLFDPAWMGLPAAEADLQLSGEMAAPLNERSIWLAVDSVLSFQRMAESGSAPSLLAAQRDVLSGRPIREVQLPLAGEPTPEVCAQLARHFLASAPPAAGDQPARTGPGAGGQDTPMADDARETVLVKALRHLARDPNDPQRLIAAADAFHPWARGWTQYRGKEDFALEWYQQQKLLDRAIRVLSAAGSPTNAAYDLASALWRKRAARTCHPWRMRLAACREKVPLAVAFEPLLRKYPGSVEVRGALSEREVPDGQAPLWLPEDLSYLETRFYNRAFAHDLGGLTPTRWTGDLIPAIEAYYLGPPTGGLAAAGAFDLAHALQAAEASPLRAATLATWRDALRAATNAPAAARLTIQLELAHALVDQHRLIEAEEAAWAILGTVAGSALRPAAAVARRQVTAEPLAQQAERLLQGLADREDYVSTRELWQGARDALKRGEMEEAARLCGHLYAHPAAPLAQQLTAGLLRAEVLFREHDIAATARLAGAISRRSVGTGLKADSSGLLPSKPERLEDVAHAWTERLAKAQRAQPQPDPELARDAGRMREEVRKAIRTQDQAAFANAMQQLAENEAEPQAIRLTSAVEYAMLLFRTRHVYEATAVLRDVFHEAQGSGLKMDPAGRPGTLPVASIEDLAVSGLRHVRLYAEAQIASEEVRATTAAVPEELQVILNDLAQGPLSYFEQSDRRRNALQKLVAYAQAHGAQAAAAVPHLLAMLVNGDPTVTRDQAPLALANIGAPAACAIPVLILVAQEDSPHMKINVGFALKKLGAASRDAWPLLARMLDHQSPSVRIRAAGALIKAAALENPELKALKDDQRVDWVRQWWAAGGAGTPRP